MRAESTTHPIFEAVMDRLEVERDTQKAVINAEAAAELETLCRRILGDDERDHAALTLSMLAQWLVRNGELRAAAKLRATARAGLGSRFERIDLEVREVQACETGARFTRFADPRDTRAARAVRPASPSAKSVPARAGVQFQLAAALGR